jgi:diguanylate cyclase (GGDEF)-like protein
VGSGFTAFSLRAGYALAMRIFPRPPSFPHISLFSAASLHDVFILAAVMLAAFVFALEYDIVQTADTMSARERRVTLAETFLLAGGLMVGLLVFSMRRLREQKREFERRLMAEREVTEARSLANSDSLTGLHNRRSLYAAIDRRLALSPAATHALILLDLNRFKAVNDVFGHSTGDKVLECIGQRLKSIADDGMMAARLGGDEFAIFCPSANRIEDVTGIAQSAVAAIEAPIVVDKTEHFVGAAIGIAFYPQDAQARQDLLRHADLALYRAKADDKSAIRLYA